MTAQRPLESVLKRTTSRPFRFKFSLFYIGITGVIAYLSGMTGCDKSGWIDEVTGIGLLLLILVALEWFEQNRFSEPPSTRMALLYIGARMLIIEGIVGLDCSGVALFLYPMVSYSAYFAFGSRGSMAMSVFYILLAIWRTGSPGDWYLDSEMASNLLAFTFVMLFVPLIAHVIRLDDENRQRTEKLLTDLEISHLKLQAYTEQVAELAAAEERNRLARDIHDSVGHYLTAVNIQLEKAILYQDRNPEEARQAIMDAKEAAADALSDVRRSVNTLRNPEERFSLKDSLDKLVEGINNDQLSIDLTFIGDEIGYPRSVRMALFRAAQEGLTNIQKHAQAGHVELNIHLGSKEALLTLRDDGRGFDPKVMNRSDSTQQQGYGLSGIRERLELIRGKLALASSPESGTVLTVAVPRNPIGLENSQQGN